MTAVPRRWSCADDSRSHLRARNSPNAKEREKYTPTRTSAIDGSAGEPCVVGQVEPADRARDPDRDGGGHHRRQPAREQACGRGRRDQDRDDEQVPERLDRRRESRRRPARSTRARHGTVADRARRRCCGRSRSRAARDAGSRARRARARTAPRPSTRSLRVIASGSPKSRDWMPGGAAGASASSTPSPNSVVMTIATAVSRPMLGIVAASATRALLRRDRRPRRAEAAARAESRPRAREEARERATRRCRRARRRRSSSRALR